MKPAIEFPTSANRLDGLNARCKPCAAAKTRAWRNANPEAARASEMRWQRNNPERVRANGAAAMARYLERNPDANREAARRWRERNPDVYRAGSARHARANPTMYAVKAAMRRAQQKHATPAWLTAEDMRNIAAVYAEARRLTVETGVPHCVDHIVPLQSPIVCGLHVPWNLRAITRRENQAKLCKIIEDESADAGGARLTP